MSGKSKSDSSPVPKDECPADDSKDFAGQFNVKKLNEHLALCLRANNNSNATTPTTPTAKAVDTPDRGANGDGDNESFKSFGEQKFEIVMDEYIQIFQQLYKFFCMLGTVFSFVGSDVKAKVEILQEYRDGSNRDEYETVEKMLHFEKSNGVFEANRLSNGSRTFLRLHRAIVFVSQFLEKSMTIKDDTGTAHVCKEAYNLTLAKYHPWVIQNGAKLAMYALPTKKELFRRVCADHIKAHEIDEYLVVAIRNTQQIFDECELLYKKYDALNLP
jgi:hypothetical protein